MAALTSFFPSMSAVNATMVSAQAYSTVSQAIGVEYNALTQIYYSDLNEIGPQTSQRIAGQFASGDIVVIYGDHLDGYPFTINRVELTRAYDGAQIVLIGSITQSSANAPSTGSYTQHQILYTDGTKVIIYGDTNASGGVTQIQVEKPGNVSVIYYGFFDVSVGSSYVTGTVHEILITNGAQQAKYSGLGVSWGEADDYVHSSDGFALHALSGNDTITGGPNGDGLSGYAGNDYIDGKGGNDTLNAGTGVDTVDGGAGTDTLVLLGNQSDYLALRFNGTDVQFSNQATGESVLMKNVEVVQYGNGTTVNVADLVVGDVTTGNDLIVGSARDDSLPGLAGNDTLRGLAGNDTLDGGTGADSLVGGTGDDTYLVDNVGDVVVELPGDGTDTVVLSFVSNATYTLGANVENARVNPRFDLSSSVTVIGNSLDNYIAGSPRAEYLQGAAGNDTLEGGGGNDTLEGGSGNDVYYVGAGGTTVIIEQASEGVDEVRALGTSYTLDANVENLFVYSNSGFTGRGNSLANSIVGNIGNDLLYGGAGNDTMDGGATFGNDTLYGEAGDDLLHGGDQNDVLDGGDGNDALFGDTGDDLLRGGAGNDTLNGGSGRDTLDGGTGNDMIIGGGTDGFGGIDTYAVGVASSTAVVRINSIGQWVISSSQGDDTLQGISALQFSDATFTITDTASAVNTVVAVSTDGTGKFHSSLGQLADGGYVVVWLAGSGAVNSSHNQVHLQRYNSSGIVVGADVIVNDTADAVGYGAPAVTGLAAGGYVASWITFDGTTGYHAQVRIYGSNGAALSEETDSNISGSVSDVKLTSLDGGGFAMAVTSYSFSLMQTQTRLQLFTATGEKTGGEVVVATNVNQPSIATLSDGSLQLAWRKLDTGQIMTQHFDASGTVLGAATAVASPPYSQPASKPDIAAMTDGGFVLSWTGYYGVSVARFDSAGQPVGTPFSSIFSGTSPPHVAALADGGYVVVSESYVTVFDSGNNAILVNRNYVAAQPYAGYGSSPDITALPADGFVLTWQRNPDDTSSSNPNGAIFSRTFDSLGQVISTGHTLTGDNQANTLHVEGDFAVSIAGLGGNDLITGGTTADTLDGGNGNDTLDGAGGDDSLIGGAGDDLYFVDTAGDAVVELAGGGNDTVRTSLNTYVLPTNVEQLTFTGTGNFAGTGNALANTITGGAGNDTLDGGAGIDSLTGGMGDDTYVLDNGLDVVVEQASGGIDTARLAFTANGTYTMAANLEKAVITANAGIAVSVTGNALDNTITANAAVETIDGATGNDTVIVLGNFADYARTRSSETDTVLTRTLNPGEVITLRNVELVQFADGPKTLAELWQNALTVFADSWIGDDDANLANGLAGNDTLVGLGGNDTLIGGTGTDSLVGGLGDDTYEVDVPSDVIVELAGQGTDNVRVNFTSGGTYVLSGNVENATVTSTTTSVVVSITGNELDNYLTGGLVTNYLTGGAGNDTLDGAGGTDVMAGGIGNDTYIIDIPSDIINENAGEGTDTVNVAFTAAGSYTLAANVENGVITAANNIAVVLNGNELANTLTGNAGNNTLNGGAGNDTIIAGTGVDVVDGGADVDTLNVLGPKSQYTISRPNATDTVLVNTVTGENITLRNIEFVKFGADAAITIAEVQAGQPSAFDDLITGTPSGETLDGLAGNDTILGLGGNDSLIGGLGNDSLDGGTGDDTMVGGAGNDTYVVDSLNDVIVETPGNGLDAIQTALASYTLGAVDVENLTFTGSGSFIGTGNTLNNVIAGGVGNDTLDGGLGADTLAGGLGDDVYLVDSTSDVVTELAGQGIDEIRTVLGSYALGTNIENLKYVGTGNFAGTGNALNNVMSGAAGSDTLAGGDGADVLSGMGGNDNLLGGAGNDTLDAGTGIDVVDGGADVDTLNVLGPKSQYTISRPNATDTVLVNTVTGENITLRNVEFVKFGADAPMTIADVQAGQPSQFNDSITGTAGNDTIDGLAGNDTMVGLAGDDTYVVDNPNDVIIEAVGGGTDTVRVNFTAGGTYVLSANVENATVTSPTTSVVVSITGNELDNYLTGGLVTNYLTGGAGNDTLDGAGGTDVLAGGTGNDTYVIDIPEDIVRETAAEGTDTVNVAFTAAGSYTLAANIENGVITAANNIAITLAGNELANTLTGNGGNNTLNGGAGNDTIIAGTGVDVVDGGADSDTLNVLGPKSQYTVTRPNATDTVLVNSVTGENITLRNVEFVKFGADAAITIAEVQAGQPSAFDDLITGTSGNDSLDGLAGNDTIIGQGGNDTLIGGLGNDSLDGGTGDDTMVGGAGNDTYVVDSLADVIVETAGNGLDTVQTALSNYTLAAVDVENLTFTGSGGFTGTGNTLNNVITGGAGNDWLDGAAGSDTMVGGLGDDHYFVDSLSDVIVEQAGGGHDWVALRLTAASTYIMAANVEEAVVDAGFNAPLNIIGNDLDNLIAGNLAANSLSGGLGNDLIGGLDGNDTLDGGAGDDSLMGGLGNDSLLGGTGNDTLNAGTGVDVVDGGADVDTLNVVGPKSQYTISRPNATDTVLVNTVTGENITLRNIEFVKFGSDAPMTIADVQAGQPSQFNDSITGTAGNDTIDGLAGNDTMVGLAGDDTYVVDNPNDVVIEAVGGGTDTVRVNFTAGGNYVLGANVENGIVTSPTTSVVVSITGNELDNYLIGGLVTNYLTGGAGNDTLDGAGGTDVLAGGTGNDTYVIDIPEDIVRENAGEGTDTVNVAFTSAGSYTLAANIENGVIAAANNIAVVLNGNELANTLTGNGGNNVLNGGAGNDTLIAGTGVDVVDGGADSDTLNVLGPKSQYTISRPNATDTVLVNTVTGENITLRNIEFVKFGSDAPMTIADVQAGQPSQFNDSITGTAGNDTIDGLAGNDTMVGLAGDDTYVVDNPNDVVIEAVGGGTDTVRVNFTAGGTYVLGANVENGIVTSPTTSVVVSITGNELDNYLTGGLVTNYLTGGAGNDTLDGAGGTDVLTGGIGNDTYIIDVPSDIINENAGEGTDTVNVAFTAAGSYTLAGNIENGVITAANNIAITLAGNELANTLTGNGGNNVLNGGAGNDTLIAGTGIDVVDGGADSDTLNVLGPKSQYTISRPNATDTVLVNTVTGENITLRNVEFLKFGSDAPMTIADVQIGAPSAFNDVLTGTSGNDTLDGLAGNDTLIGLGGDDVYIVDSINDVIVEALNGGTDTVRVSFSSGTYVLGDNVENGIVTSLTTTTVVNITGNELDNYLTGGLVTNYLTGGAGNDTLDGGGGTDVMAGGVGNDTYVVDIPEDIIRENANEGIDTVRVAFTSAGSYTLTANVENGTITAASNIAIALNGNELDNVLTGNAGNNVLNGGAGNDTLIGGAGSDTLTGGAGNDTFVLNSTIGVDVITDFVAGLDKIAVSKATFGAITGNVGDSASLASLGSSIAYNATSGALTYDADGAGGADPVTIAIIGQATHPATLNADFLIVA